MRNEATVTASPLDADAPTLNDPVGEPIELADEANVDIILLASIGDFVWHDVDGDGLQDTDEPGIEGVVVELIDAGGSVVGTDTTDADGRYGFDWLDPADYHLEFAVPDGFVVSPINAGGPDADSDGDDDGVTAVTTLDEDEDDLSWDLGVYEPASLGDRIWLDNHRDGLQEDGEPGVGGIIVHLLDAEGSIVETTSTDDEGNYLFENLAPGSYAIRIELPDGGYGITTPNCCDEDADSDIDPATRQSGLVVLISGDDHRDLDGGLYQLASLGDVIWLDLDDDGAQGSGEPGVPGVTVVLLDGDGAELGSTVTDDSGNYLFVDLEPGTYMIEVRPELEHVLIDPDRADDELDSDVSKISGRSPQVELAPGDARRDVDAGLVDRDFDLGVTKELDENDTARRLAIWEIVVTNNGPHAAPGPVTITDALPDGLTFEAAVGDGWDCSHASGTVTCTWGQDVASGETLPPAYIETSYAAADGDITNDVIVTSVYSLQTTRSESIVFNNSSSASISVTGSSRSGGGPLAFTGGSAGTTALFGAVLLAVGLGLAALARRRRSGGGEVA